jgi:predicted O-linked N-acetylglucosamine transferase (SPINDLY family)
MKKQPQKTVFDAHFCKAVRKFATPVAAFYADVAGSYYEQRGQIEHALAEWQRAEELNSEDIDSKVCQAALKSTNKSDCDRLAAQLQWARRHAISLHDQSAIEFTPFSHERRIVVGYLCGWWDSSTIRGQAIPFISKHDRSRFKVIGYSPARCGTPITQFFDEFRVVGKLSHVELAELVRRDKCDVLVEFTGFSPNHRFAVMGARCAPVQISYLNHAGTCGIANVDYVIGDDVALPEEYSAFYSEKVLRLPGSFFNFNYDWDKFPDAGPAPCINAGHLTFGCFGGESKINDAQIYMWAKLLLALPRARLFLRNRGLASAENREFMARRFRQWGVDESRLRIERGGDRYSILRNYGDVDISLDTWPYNGGNTIAESLWQGVPVLTILGGTFASRYGASLLAASGCADLVASDLDDLIRKAQELDKNRSRIVGLRTELRRMMHEFGFSDVDRFCRNWEQALATAVKSALATEALRPE